GNYEKASELFSTLSHQTEEKYALFYNAMSLMMTDQIEQATFILTDTEWSVEYNEKSDWYLALCYLSRKKPKDPKFFFKKLFLSSPIITTKPQNCYKKSSDV